MRIETEFSKQKGKKHLAAVFYHFYYGLFNFCTKQAMHYDLSSYEKDLNFLRVWKRDSDDSAMWYYYVFQGIGGLV